MRPEFRRWPDMGMLFDWKRNIGPLYLYLARPEYAETWINGGTVPIAPASTYRSVERRGVNTPVELVHRSFSPGTSEIIAGALSDICDGDVWFDDVTYQEGDLIVENVNAWKMESQHDALILCFARKKSWEICRRLEKTTVVQLTDPIFLLNTINDQIGCTGELAVCAYTNTRQRNHFLKSTADAWQHEARMVWQPPIVERRSIEIPKGAAEPVNFDNVFSILQPSYFRKSEYDECFTYYENWMKERNRKAVEAFRQNSFNAILNEHRESQQERPKQRSYRLPRHLKDQLYREDKGKNL